MAEAANATYLRWVNADIENAHFRRCATAWKLPRRPYRLLMVAM